MKPIVIFLTILFSHSVVSESCLDSDALIDEKASISKAIDLAKQCETTADCEVKLFSCPFGCFQALNKHKSAELLVRVDNFQEKACTRCMYRCKGVESASCIKNRCVEQYTRSKLKNPN